MKRVFLAIQFKDNLFLSQYINNIQSSLIAENIKWIEAKNMHLTLHFFGKIDNNLIGKVILELKNTLKRQKKFSIIFNKLGIFGSKYKPRVLWLGMENTKELVQLVTKIDQSLENIGIFSDRQNFVPHLSMGRIKQLNSKKYFQSVLDKHQNFNSGEIVVDRIFLYESILHKDGATYRVLKEFAL